jgi:HEPN domain-containing protein
MRNIDIARAFIKDAAIILEEAKESFQKEHFHRTVRKCQEGVELALKGLLRLKGIEYPKSHKIGKVIIETLKDDLDMDFLQRAADISDQLAIDREPSFYGSEDTPAERLFEEDDAKESVEGADFVIKFINELLERKTV